MHLPNKTPLISIVIPVYNAEKYLGFTLQSVQAQSVTDWELIVVDDGSKDQSSSIVEAFAREDPRIRLIRQPNAGVASARNRGADEANSAAEYLILLDNDDLWPPDALKALSDALAAAPHACAAHGVASYIDGDGQPGSDAFIAENIFHIHDKLTKRLTVVENRVEPRPSEPQTGFATFAVQNCIVSPGCVLFRRSALAGIALFDQQTAPVDDWDLYLRLTRKAPFVAIPDVVLHYRLHTANASRNTSLMVNATEYTALKALRSPDNTPEQQRIMRTGYAYFQRQEMNKRLQWARDSFKQRQVVDALKHLRHACKGALRVAAPVRP